MRDWESLPRRRSVRLKGYDYAGPGSIFFTMCTEGRVLRFGEVRDKVMCLNVQGEIVQAEWHETLRIRSAIVAHAFVIMPNHFHGLITIDPDRSAQAAPMPDSGEPIALHAHKRPRSMSTLATGFKGAVSKTSARAGFVSGDDLWQRSFHEHVVRDQQAFETIKRYIETNPGKWEEDTFYVAAPG